MKIEARIAQLIPKHWKNELSELEKEELDRLLAQKPEFKAEFDRLTHDSYGWRQAVMLWQKSSNKELKNLEKAYNKLFSLNRPVRRELRHAIAASLIVSITVICFYFLFSNINKEAGSNKSTYAKVAGIKLDGLHKSTFLRLADGTSISLDTVRNRVFNQGDYRVIVDDNTITYTVFRREPDNRQQQSFNCISTTSGRQCKIELPDGSTVWLNAASSIIFPVSFCNRNRTVELTGEGYFDIRSVYSDQTKIPFIVNVKSHTGLEQQVIVTGTRFNIKAYGDEYVIKTTLLEGSIAIGSGCCRTMLKEGEALQLSKSGRIRLYNVAMKEVIAWKNDLFVFQDLPIEYVLKEIGRWYGLRLVFEADISSRISLMASRSLPCEELLKAICYQNDYKLLKQGDTVRILKP